MKLVRLLFGDHQIVQEIDGVICVDVEVIADTGMSDARAVSVAKVALVEDDVVVIRV